MRKLIVILLMPVLAQAEVNLSVRITGAQTTDFFVGITSFSGEVDDLIVLVTGETAVATSKGALVQKKPINYRPPPHRLFEVTEYMTLRKWEDTHTYCMEATGLFKKGISWLQDILKFDRTDPCTTFKGEARPQRKMWPTYYRQPSWQYFRLCALYRTCVNGGSNPNTKVVYH